ncbi:glycosyltransferase family 2 protein [Rubripirellula sp.]|nr:glycosyltransferase family 2 protein [Rubripirellula sp.]
MNQSQQNTMETPASTSADQTVSKCSTTAVILSYNSAKTISKCLSTLVDNSPANPGPERIIVVDNGSTDDSCKLIQSFMKRHSHIGLISLNTNHGTTYSRNKALDLVDTETVLILDSDAYMPSVALTIMRERLATADNVGIVAPRLEYPDGRYQLSTDQFPTAIQKLKRYFFLRAMESSSGAPSSTVDYAISAVWLLRTKTMRAVGNFDEKIFYSPEDVDYCMRVWKAGYQIVYEPAAVVVHDAQELSRSRIPNKFTFSHGLGLLYYFKKHRYWFSSSRVRKQYSIPQNN